LALQADGKILLGGAFTWLGGQTRNYSGRLNSDGSLDTAFNPGANNTVDSQALQMDGKILVGGDLTMLGGQARRYIGRLNNTDSAIQNLTYDGSNLWWQRGGTSPEVWRTTFDVTSFGIDWTSLGAGVRVSNGWQLAGVRLPSPCTVRARGFTTDGAVSSWFVEQLLELPSAGPNLGVACLSPGLVTLTWPAAATNYLLMQSTDAGGTNWVACTNDINVVGDQNQAVVLPQEQRLFFRLRRP
jgi:hypothetical protein